MNETIELPIALLRLALDEILPLDQTRVDASVDVSREFVAALADELEATDPTCDHSVGICACEPARVLADLRMALDGKRPCPTCNGEAYAFSEHALALALDAYVDRHGGTIAEAEGALGDGPGYVKCPTCLGTGVVALDAWPLCARCMRPWQTHYDPALLKFKNGPFGTFGLVADHTPFVPGVHAERSPSQGDRTPTAMGKS